MNTTTSEYLLVSRNADRKVAEYKTYDLALAAFEGVGGNDAGFAVRSIDDPRWSTRPWLGDREVERAALRGAQTWTRKEYGATALTFLKTAQHAESLDRVIAGVRASLRARGLDPSSYQLEDAVKARITVGRCRSSRYGGPGCDRAYWLLKSEGRLADQKCPHCERQLSQTTLAYGKRPFLRLSFPKVGG